ncbi:hypothetical protein BDY21DRAFT_384262 [Lineolata rhizophorae]|uniref:Bromodomain associated domain-containing protein n=1 Tax=Lineolata rhizophorae TaxID=578093 RepID=A0A6A6P7F7_9PEZI|nr:hypothetical protein BDY21DRAFT_384262 [Lineolata rhizophorae]
MLHTALLRPTVLHILRAAGFHSARPSVIDVLTDIMARYLHLLAVQTAAHATHNHNDLEPTITDVRLAMADCGVFLANTAASEEAWREAFRKPLEEYPERNGIRAREMARRDAEDTADVREFIEWVKGDAHKEIRRIAGFLPTDAAQGVKMDDTRTQPEDYLTVLKKKHNKTGEESRYQGTVLGIAAESKPIKIEGGPAESLAEWNRQAFELSRKAHEKAEKNGKNDTRMETDEPHETNGDPMQAEQ